MTQQGDGYYTPERLDSIIKAWVVLSSSYWPRRTSGSAGVNSPFARRSGGSSGGSALSTAILRADVARALRALPEASKGRLVITLRMSGIPFRDIEASMGMRHSRASRLYWDCLREMAHTLGWKGAAKTLDGRGPAQLS